MDKRYLFLSASKIQRAFFMDSLCELGIDRSSFTFDSDVQGDFVADSTLAPSIDDVLSVLHDDLGANLSVLCAHEKTPFELKLLQNAARYFPNQCCFPTDVILREMSFGDFSSFAPLRKLFKDLPRELILTAGAYLRCGLDASLAANKLLIHRNTFRYRLDAFIDRTGLDIRDYHNALLLELYFDLSAGRI